MGFTTATLCINDQEDIKTLEPKIINYLNMAAAKMMIDNKCSEIWFGDTSPAWITQLQQKLYSLRNAITDKEHSIEIFGPHQLTDSGRILTDYSPLRYLEYHCNRAELPDEIRNPIHGQCDRYYHRHVPGKPYMIMLSPGWYYAPMTRHNTAPTVSPTALRYPPHTRYSKFHILIHGLTHLILDTYDIMDNYSNCASLAVSSMANAKINSDNWAFFVEDAALYSC